MNRRKPVTPGVYPKIYTCVKCGKSLSKKELFAANATCIDNNNCSWKTCVRRRAAHKAEPLRDSHPEPTPHASFISVYLEKRQHRKQQCRRDFAAAQADEFLIDFVLATQEDPKMAKRFLTIVNIPSFHRGSLLSSMIQNAEFSGAPRKLLLVLHHLKNDDFAHKLKLQLSRSNS